MKRSKSLPALKSFFTKNDFNAGKLPALKSFFAKNRFIAGKNFERFIWFARNVGVSIISVGGGAQSV